MKHPTTNLWRETLAHGFKGAEFPDGSEFDAVIIGGGFTGLSAALHVAKGGGSVCVLEKKTIGHGGSGRNVGLVNAGLWTPPDDVQSRIGEKAGHRLNTLLANGPEMVFNLIAEHQIQCGAIRNGTLHCAETRRGLSDLESRYAQQLARNAPVRLLDAEETAMRTGTNKFIGALWDARAGTIQPLAYANGLARAANQGGAIICEYVTASALTQQNGKWKVACDQGHVLGTKLIQATNAYGTSGLPANEFVPVHYFQLATAPLPDARRKSILPGGEGCWDCANVMSSFRLNEDGRFLIGAVGNLDGFAGGLHRAWARRKLRFLFPALTDLEFEHAWTGRIAFTSDHLPKVTRIGVNAVSIYGYSGRGIAPGTVFGKCAADWVIRGTETAFPIAIREEEREGFKRLRAFVYESGAAATHLVQNRQG